MYTHAHSLNLSCPPHHPPRYQLTSIEVLFLPLSTFNTLSLLCFSTPTILMPAQGAESERALTSDSDTSGAREEQGRRGAVLICLLTSSMLPIANTVEAGMHRGREGSAHTCSQGTNQTQDRKRTHTSLQRSRTYMKSQ